MTDTLAIPAPPDPNDPILYPRFTPEQMKSLARVAVCRVFAPGEMLFDHGDRDAPFYILERGEVEFYDRLKHGDTPVLRLAQRVFIGDLAMFTGEPTLASCHAATDVQTLMLTREQLRRVMAQHPDIGDMVLRAMMARRAWLESNDLGSLQLIGPRWSPKTYRLREFLSRNQVPFRWYDTASDEAAKRIMEQAGSQACGITGKHVERDPDDPIIVAADGICRAPTIEGVARELGLRPDLDGKRFDVAVLGGGPAGLAATVYAASEGLQSLLIDAHSPGGQAGTSSKIENYLGFPMGISGSDLARAATLQARKFGATLANPCAVLGMTCARPTPDFAGGYELDFECGEHVTARTVVIATGAEYRKLDGIDCERFEGKGVFYGATQMEGTLCAGEDVVIVGGGNSAGQAAVFLSGVARSVRILIRGESLAATMSQYLIDRIDEIGNISLHPRSRVLACHGVDRLHEIDVASEDAALPARLPCAALFVMIGAKPRTEWIREYVLTDEHGFVLTGQDLKNDARFAARWTKDRDPFPLETSRPGVFAVGDVRSGSIKRVATAVGEGSMAVALVHRVLAEQTGEAVRRCRVCVPAHAAAAARDAVAV